MTRLPHGADWPCCSADQRSRATSVMRNGPCALQCWRDTRRGEHNVGPRLGSSCKTQIINKAAHAETRQVKESHVSYPAGWCEVDRTGPLKCELAHGLENE